MRAALVPLIPCLLALTGLARAQTAAPYDEHVAKARTAAQQERWADCARLYDLAIKAFPADQSRPQSELSDLRENRELCRQRKPAPLPPPLVALGKLSMNVPRLIGRQDELKQLEEAWDGRTRRQIVAVVAVGGQGKTTLVVNWLLRMRAQAFRGARRVFAWSFYSQGTSDDRAGSSDEFLAVALKFFGDPTPDSGNPFEKAARLRDLLRKDRSLLILDGLEPLQYAHDAPEGEGVLRDRAMGQLLTDLAASHPGLVVVTSRVKLGGLQALEDGPLKTLLLRPFSDGDGVALLKYLGTHGSDGDLVAAVQEAHGHPLTLSLLGNLLHDAYGGDIAKRSEVVSLKPGTSQGLHAQHVMAAYDRSFKSGGERAVLRLLGLFDRPAPGAALQALRAEPAVPGLNEALVGLSDGAWNQVLSRLRRAGLVEPENTTDATGVDAHPLVREFFGEVLKHENEAAWREGHARLYTWYAASAKDLPDTAEEMAPLYAAVFHGCRAGRHQEVLEKVFWPRIRRRNEHYSTIKLGAFGAELSALAGFFSTPWTKPVSSLRERDRAFFLNAAGYALRAQGRLEEAAAPMRAALETDRAQKDWMNASKAASNLSELLLGLGQVREATSMARQTVELADRSGDAFLRLLKLTDLADALHQGGQLEEAQRLFQQAEALQREHRPAEPFLYSLQGYQYCDLRLAQGASDEVLQRAGNALEVARQNSWLLSIGLDHLSLGRAHATRLAAGQQSSAGPAREHLHQAVTRLRESGDQLYLPLGLRHRAAWFRQTRDYASAARDLDEGLLLAKRAHMRLHECDLHLERARLFQAQKKLREAREELRIAREIVEQTGYERRSAEVERLTRELAER